MSAYRFHVGPANCLKYNEYLRALAYMEHCAVQLPFELENLRCAEAELEDFTRTYMPEEGEPTQYLDEELLDTLQDLEGQIEMYQDRIENLFFFRATNFEQAARYREECILGVLTCMGLCN